MKTHKKNETPEHNEQVALIQWCKLHERKYPGLELLYATPNAGKRTPRQGAWMKAEGMKAGVPDLCLPVARGKYHAMYIEMKVPPNKPTKEQAVWIDNLRAQGCLSIVAYDWDSARKAIEAYFELPA